MIELGPDRALRAAVAGEGLNIVLVHGALATHQDWVAGPFGAIASVGRAIAIDRPGHGGSRRPRFEDSPVQHARQVRSGLDQLGVTRPVLVAHSFGSLVALALAADDPGYAAHLVLIAPVAFREVRLLEHSLLAPRAAPLIGPLWANMLSPIFDRAWVEAVHRLMFAPGAPPDSWRASYPWSDILDRERTVAEGEDFLALHPLAPDIPVNLAAIETPVTILAGTADLIVDWRSQGERLAGCLTRAHMKTVQGEGHMLHHNRPELVTDAITQALRVEV